jgi:hypothetical protein
MASSDSTTGDSTVTVLTEQNNKKKTQAQKPKRTTWTSAEEKQFLVICAESAIADQLDKCVTSAGVSPLARACTFCIFLHLAMLILQ